MVKRMLPAIALVCILTCSACPGYGFQESEPTAATASEPATQESSADATVSATKDQSADDEQAADSTGFFARVNEALEPADGYMKNVNGKIGGVIFYGVPLNPQYAGMAIWNATIGRLSDDLYELPESTDKMPLAVLVLLLGAVYFTLRMGFINLRGFWHAIRVTAGKYDDPNHQGEVSHFQALTAALSATVGLGNIAGVAIAISMGGPGATLWMILAGFIGMSSKFVECTLGQKYRQERTDGRIMGGAMYYLLRGIPELGMGAIGKGLGAILAVAFAVLCIGGSFAGGNSFQVNQSMRAVGYAVPWFAEESHFWVYGLVMAVLVAIVIIGGIRRIAAWAEKIVPTMCGIYVLAAAVILLKNASAIPEAMQLIVRDAFTGQAVTGGLLGVLIMGFKRAAFSNEAGIGSAAIAHAAAKTDYPVREGLVALLGPFIDTIIICTMTALVITITGVWNNPEYAHLVNDNNGAALTSVAMDSQISGFRYVLAVAVFLFAFSTMISWSYYGERCWAFLFGDWSSIVYRIIFVLFTFLGAVISATNILEFGDLMIFGMAIPNVIGVVLLSGRVKRDLDDYWRKLKAGEFKKYK